MMRIRAVIVAMLAPGLVACAHGDADQRVGRQLAMHHSSCLIQGFAVHSAAHTDCVLARYEERQQQQERLREAVLPASKARSAGPADGESIFPSAGEE